jgi:hypothetical protein
VTLAVGLALLIGGALSSRSNAVAAASPPAATAVVESRAPAQPAGVAAPADPAIANFDSGKPDAAYGIGWSATSDSVVGGGSTAAVRVVDGALEITGEIKPGFQWPFAAAVFFPSGPPMKGMTDYSSRKTLSFRARGDGRKYLASFFSTADPNSIPSSYRFDTGAEWREVRVPLAEYVVDLSRVRGIMIGSGGGDGVFRLEIDDVRIE